MDKNHGLKYMLDTLFNKSFSVLFILYIKYVFVLQSIMSRWYKVRLQVPASTPRDICSHRLNDSFGSFILLKDFGRILIYTKVDYGI